jgi:hypothetical protein
MTLWKRKKGFKTFEAALGGDSSEIREAALSYLRSHRSWYAFWSRAYTLTWNVATFAIIVLGALTSILTAYDVKNRALLIILPAVSSLLGAFIIQFRLRDAWRLRELGRIAVEELICEAYLIPIEDRGVALREAFRLRLCAHKLERDQLSEFFGEATNLRKSGSDQTAP